MVGKIREAPSVLPTSEQEELILEILIEIKAQILLS